MRLFYSIDGPEGPPLGVDAPDSRFDAAAL
jgi:hypothetical protein